MTKPQENWSLRKSAYIGASLGAGWALFRTYVLFPEELPFVERFADTLGGSVGLAGIFVIVAWIRNKMVGGDEKVSGESQNIGEEVSTMHHIPFLRIGIGLGIAMGLFPPWHFVIPAQGYNVQLGYAFIASPPDGGQIDIMRLLVQWAIVAAATWGASKIWGPGDK